MRVIKEIHDPLEEIKSAVTEAEKQQLLQKFGYIDPKLTEKEKALCNL
jgi:hypothetical protein